MKFSTFNASSLHNYHVSPVCCHLATPGAPPVKNNNIFVSSTRRRNVNVSVNVNQKFLTWLNVTK